MDTLNLLETSELGFKLHSANRFHAPMKTRSLNELRQTRDAVYTPPTSHDQSLRDRLEGRSYLVLDAEGLPEVTCDDVQCILDVRPTLSGEEVLAHFDGGATAMTLPDGGSIRVVPRRKRS